MDPIRNPYAPGAGTPPPELSGRDDLLQRVEIVLERLRARRATKSFILLGLRGVGKTVLLNRMQVDAEAAGICTLRAEAPEGRSLPGILAPQLRQSLLRLSRNAQAADYARRALRALAGFVRALKVKYRDIEVVLDVEPEVGLADNGDLELDLQQLLEVVGEAAARASTAVVIFLDELQYIPEADLAAMITALHRTSQLLLPVTMIGAGLPQLPGQLGRAKSYAERLFEFSTLGPLPAPAARDALVIPARELGVEFEEAALDRILAETRGYPYFLQEWGKQSWDTAASSPIRLTDVQSASELIVAALDEGFFRVRFDRLAPSEKRYLRAMAELGEGPHRSGDIAAAMKRNVRSIAPTRAGLIAKGMIWSPSHGDTAFTVPLFDQFMRRIMPDRDWLNGE